MKVARSISRLPEPTPDIPELSTGSPSIAIAHDYLTQRGGAEKVVLALSRAFPGSPIYTTLYDAGGTYPEFAALDVRVSPLNTVTGFRKWHRSALPVLPFASSLINIDADIVIASSSGWAHGFRTRGKVLVYCYTPARWLYQTDAYLGEHGTRVRRACLALLGGPLKLWDRRAASKATRYLAISSVVRERITATYGRSSTVVHAPYTLDESIRPEPIDILADCSDFYLCVSRMLPYKNVDKVVRAFNGTARSLVVVGSGPEEAHLRGLAEQNIIFLKNLPDEQMAWAYANCRGLVSSSYEDFGLTPLEASAHGRPSAVLRWGGFLETVDEDVTGVFFDNPDPIEIRAAVDNMESHAWCPDDMRNHVQQFSEARFSARMIEMVRDLV